jgi:hypothetical protein
MPHFFGIHHITHRESWLQWIGKNVCLELGFDNVAIQAYECIGKSSIKYK